MHDMNTLRPLARQRRSRDVRGGGSRRGVVAVEFAMTAPILLAVVVGLIELSRIYEVQNTLDTAAREGARFASMDRTGMIADGESVNEKLANDVKNFLAAMGHDRSAIEVSVLDAADPSQSFDLNDPENDLGLFQVKVEMPYSSISYTPMPSSNDYTLSASITFRNGRTTYAH